MANQGAEESVLSALREKGLIDAIKVYRQSTGLGLKESKQAVEALAERHGVELPRSGVGCVLVIALVLLGATAGLLFLFARG